MNCKPGDLAVFVKHDKHEPEDRALLGLVIRVIAIDPDWHEPVWLYEGDRKFDADGRQVIAFSDRHLRPIRDSDGEDEMLRIAGKPQEVNA